MADAGATSAVVEAELRLIDALHSFDVVGQRLRCQLRAFEPTTVLEDLLETTGDSTSRLTVLTSEEANRQIEARLKDVSAESEAARERLKKAIGAFRALEDQMSDAPEFLRAIGRWIDEIESDLDAVHGAARRRNCRRRAERCLGVDSPIHKRPRYSRLPTPEPDGAELDVTLAQIGYTAGHVAAYAETYASQQAVARGQRLAHPYIYADDGTTVLCPSCLSRRIVSINESLVINTGSKHEPLIAALGDGLTPEEFLSAPAHTWHCANCGRWVVQQEIVGEDYRYCLQLVGALGSYENPDEELRSTLVDRLGGEACVSVIWTPLSSSNSLATSCARRSGHATFTLWVEGPEDGTAGSILCSSELTTSSWCRSSIIHSDSMARSRRA